MVLRVEALRQRLLKLDEVVAQLVALSTRDRATLSRLPDRWLVERGLQLGAELDPVRVLDHLADAPADFTDFTAAIRRWLDGQPA
ncbi:MAG TPA: hypothetical protein VF121_00670 [Thermoanaerobaculia bacterium]|nr:hypothetical protein [Thermoanaerobaculia bacterium]